VSSSRRSIVTEKKADDLIIERHEANGQLFEATFDKPGVRELFMKYLASSYDESAMRTPQPWLARVR